MKTLIAQLTSAACFALGAGSASAARIQLLGRMQAASATLYQFSSAVAENASTICFNPAGMAAAGSGFPSASIWVRPTFKFDDRGSIERRTVGFNDSGDAGSWAFHPQRRYLVGAQQGSLRRYRHGRAVRPGHRYDDSMGRCGAGDQVRHQDHNLNPSIAYPDRRQGFVGFGLNWQRMEVEYRQIPPRSPVPRWQRTSATLDVSTTPGAGTSAPCSTCRRAPWASPYRSAIKHELDGDLRVSGPAASRMQR